MKKKSIAIMAGLLIASSFNILSLGGKAFAVGNGNNVKCQPFKMNQVHLLPSRFQENMKRDSAWMMSIPVSSLLQSFRNTSGAFSSREGGYMTVKKTRRLGIARLRLAWSHHRSSALGICHTLCTDRLNGSEGKGG